MNKVLKIIGIILLIALLGYLLWRFSFLIVYTLIAVVVSFVGHPIVHFLESLRYKKFRIPHSVSSVIALVVLLVGFFSLFAIFVPLINQQINTISQIDLNSLTTKLRGPLAWIEEQALHYGLVPEGSTLQSVLAAKAKTLVSYSAISNALSSILGVAGSFFVGLASVIFIAFFFIKDEELFASLILLVTPENSHSAVKLIMSDSKILLRRYFVGLLLELLGVMTVITLGLSLLGIKNALLLGFFGGLMNIVPYVGPIIGTLIGLTLGVTSALATGDVNMLPLIIKIVSVFLVANSIDNMVLQPLIYSSSVKAHPLEIFYVIIVGGSLWGIAGMIVAVPVYTLLRIIAREFLSKFRIVQTLTRNLQKPPKKDEESGEAAP